MQLPFANIRTLLWKSEFTPGAVVRRDGTVVRAQISVRAAGVVHFLDKDFGGPTGRTSLSQEGVTWARGKWDSEAVVALRALAAIERAR